MALAIDTDFPGGNLRVVGTNGRETVIAQDVRDTTTHWFYWCFRARFDAPGEYAFRFDGRAGPALGARGPAVSEDEGQTWHWLAPTGYDVEGEAFRYVAAAPGTVRFALSIPHHQTDWEAWAAGVRDRPGVRFGALCRSREGRAVECFFLDEDARDRPALLLTARHHCCEMTAGHVMEGWLQRAMDDPAVRSAARIVAVPFVDKDGVVHGDQGKNRAPHDHGRDYRDDPRYPETAAIMAMTARERFAAVVDLHNPWLRGGRNETAFWVGPSRPEKDREARALARRVEVANDSGVPFSAERDYLPFGQEWNVAANQAGGGRGLARWAADREGVRLAVTLETPYANAGAFTFSRDDFRAWGGALARAMAAYLTGDEAEKRNGATAH